MKTNILTFLFIIISNITLANENKNMPSKPYNKLTEKEINVIINKGTEKPFSGEYNDFFKDGIYQCKRCDTPLYNSSDKFKSGCGWPSFDDEIKGAIKRVADADGRRTEIICAKCGGHLGHVFTGEKLTDKNVRHCVNSISMKFIRANDAKKDKLAKAYFAGGCFWGVEFVFEHKDGVTSAVSGYMGGTKNKPTYKEVCSGKTGHVETVEVIYDPAKISFEALTKYFFEIHDPTQTDGQGPDIGSQYLSVIFYNTEEEKKTAQKLIDILKSKKYKVATTLRSAAKTKFWPAKKRHQNYYDIRNKKPVCHIYKKKF